MENIKDCCFVIDFDRTLTTENCNDIWDEIITSKYVSKKHTEKHKELDKTFEPLLKSDNLKLVQAKVSRWYKLALNLFNEYDDYMKIIRDAINNNNNIKFRNGVIEFFKMTNHYNAPVYIVSAGLGDAIRMFLGNNGVLFSNIKIISNYPKSNYIVTTINKGKVNRNKEIKNSYKNCSKIIIIGDSLMDTEVCLDNLKEKTVKIGFCNNKKLKELDEYNRVFDVVLKDNKDFFDIIEVLKSI